MTAGLAALAAALGALSPAPARASAPPPAPRVLVTFDHPEKFLDIRDNYFPSAEGKERILEAIRATVAERAPLYLPKGDSLYLTFINIKLAGIYHVGSVSGETRTLLRSTPPLFMFGWAVTDTSGRVVKRAWERLEQQDLMDLYSHADSGDPLRFEKAVLDDWMRHSLQG